VKWGNVSQDTVKYERLVALAGWLWLRLRDGKPKFRRNDLAVVDGLDYFGQSSGASRKAFGRARDDLETFGIILEWDSAIPNTKEELKNGAYEISRLGLTAEQQRALIGLAFTIGFRDLSTDAALRIPGSFLDGAGETLLLEANSSVAPIADAIHNHRCVVFTYRDDSREREAQPIQLGYERGSWYLSAYEFEAGDTKIFRLDRLRNVEPSTREWDDALDTEDARVMVSRVQDRFFWGLVDLKRLVVALDSEAEPAARRLMPSLEIWGTADDGRVLLAQEYTNDENVLDAILTLGSRAEIIEPDDLRSQMIDHLSAMARRAQ
jgi:hypothetical protein